jgi:hypothetical protein
MEPAVNFALESHMLLIDARVGVSSIHGFGLIARESIPAGTGVWRFHSGLDRKISRQEFSCRMLSISVQREIICANLAEGDSCSSS